MPRVALFVLVALLTVSCEGPIGPSGSQGPQGPTGTTGGARGARGFAGGRRERQGHRGQGGQGVHRGPKERRESRLTGVRLLRVGISRLACLV